MKDGSRLLEILVKVSEKAANIARACRQNDALFKLLVQEKSEEEKNPRFFQDFKTLADVLIQETIKHDIQLEFPELAKRVQGEENNTFSNTMGECIVVEVLPTVEETTELLAKVMGSDMEIAQLLAKEVHRDVSVKDVPMRNEISPDFHLDVDDLGIWIDPIDSTADYINGGQVIHEETGIHLSGLRCVTVLIGAYVASTGEPVVGVVNQPFFANSESGWTGKCYWGYTEEEVGTSCLELETPEKEIVVLSRVEKEEIKSKLASAGFVLAEPAGAGYKILCVAMGHASAYVLSRSSTYKWDTCGPHALLKSIGGYLFDYQKFLQCECRYTSKCCVDYLPTENGFANSGGLVAFRRNSVYDSLKSTLCE